METPTEIEKSPLTTEEKSDIIAEAISSDSLEEVIAKSNRLVEEKLADQNRADEQERITNLQEDLKSTPPPAPEVTAVQEKYVAANNKFSEAQAMVSAELPWYQRMFRKDDSYQLSGETRQTKAGNSVEIVTGRDGKQYAKLVEYRGGGGDPGHQSTKNYYIPLEKAEAFLN
ncbi:MAG: hypothetical protein JWL92_36 [Candidatus Nomurabacteria bacterium]|nr:hypothetical protein [Candidatus Nomurabacteria bacterium]